MEELKKPKKNIIKKFIDLLMNFFSIESKKKRKETSKADDIYPMW